MSGERDDEELERLLDADQLPDTSADPLAALLRAAATPDADRARSGEEAAAAVFRTAFAPQPPNNAPRRRPIQRSRARRGTIAALLGVALLVPAGLALPRDSGRDPHHSPSLTASTAPLTPPPPSPGASNTTPRPLDMNATLTPAEQKSPSSSGHISVAPDLESGQTHHAKPASPSAHLHSTPAHRKSSTSSPARHRSEHPGI